MRNSPFTKIWSYRILWVHRHAWMHAHPANCCRSRRICHSVRAKWDRKVASLIRQPPLWIFSIHSISRVNINSIYLSLSLSRHGSHLRWVSMLYFKNYVAESPMYLDSSTDEKNCSHVSGVSPFFSSEDINVSLRNTSESVRVEIHACANQYEFNWIRFQLQILNFIFIDFAEGLGIIVLHMSFERWQSNIQLWMQPPNDRQQQLSWYGRKSKLQLHRPRQRKFITNWIWFGKKSQHGTWLALSKFSMLKWDAFMTFSVFAEISNEAHQGNGRFWCVESQKWFALRTIVVRTGGESITQSYQRWLQLFVLGSIEEVCTKLAK